MKLSRYKDGLWGYAKPDAVYFKDLAVQDEDGNRYSAHFTTSEADLLAEGYELVHVDEMIRRSEEHYTSDVVEIDEDRWMDALEVLPPGDWIRTGDAESFYCAEFLSGNVTAQYVRLGSKHYCYNAVVEGHADRIKRVLASAAYKETV